MKLFKDGKDVLIDKDQLHIMLDAGWSFTVEESTSEENVKEEKVIVADQKITVEPNRKKPVRKSNKIAPKKITKKE